MRKKSLDSRSLNLKANYGYTLIEMLIVISVTAILTGLVLVYNRSNENQIILYRDQAMIVGVINRAKALAIQKFRDSDFEGYDSCAFGVHFEPPPSKEFILFGDLEEGGCTAGRAYMYNAASDPPEEIERFSLDPKLEFSGIETPFDILFIPPDLNAVTTNPLGFPVSINLKTASGGGAASIIISAAGQIVQ